MEPIKEIGEFKITISNENEDVEYFFKPSFENIMKIGSPSEIVESYAILNGSEINRTIALAFDAFGSIPDIVLKAFRSRHYGGKIFSTAMNVMRSCCYVDATPLIGYYKHGMRGLVYVPGAISIDMIIALARNLLDHGIIGRANLRVPARDEKGYSAEFNAAEYITSARVNFNMPISEARQLSMTELHMMIKQKYPEPKGFTRAEIGVLTERYELERDQALGKKPKTHEWKKITLDEMTRSKKNDR